MAVTRISTPGNCPIAVYVHSDSGRLMDAYGFTVTCCGKCGGVGTLPGYEFSDGARCWKCMRRGYYLTPAVERERAAFVANIKGRKVTDIRAHWTAARCKVESDIVDALVAQVAAHNAKVV